MAKTPISQIKLAMPSDVVPAWTDALTWGDPGDRPVLLLHGLPQTPDVFEPLAGRLPRLGFWPIAPYLYGDLSKPPRASADFDLGRFSKNVVALADHLALDSFDVVAVGMGASVGAMLAAHNPGRVRWMASIHYPCPAAVLAASARAGLQAETRSGESQQQELAKLVVPWGRERRRRLVRRLFIELGLPECHLGPYSDRLSVPGALEAALLWNAAWPPQELSHLPDVTVPLLLVLSTGGMCAGDPQNATQVGRTQIVFLEGDSFPLESASADLIRLIEEHLPKH